MPQVSDDKPVILSLIIVICIWAVTTVCKRVAPFAPEPPAKNQVEEGGETVR